jgi:hypothetical protein
MRPSRSLVLLLFPLVASCDESDDPLGLGRGERFTATLTGANVRPSPEATTATATVNLTVREPEIGSSTRSVGYAINVTGLTSVTAAHIHLGGAAVPNGPLLVTLFSNPNDTTISAAQLVTGSFSATGIGGGVSLDSLVSLMRTGNAYVDLHGRSSTSPVVRGQIVRDGDASPLDRFAVQSMTGAKERPTPVTTTATGSATFELLDGSSVRYQVRASGISEVTMAHIHTAVADSAGPIVVTLFNPASPTGTVNGVLASGTFTSTNIQLPGVSFDSLLALMRLGRTYVNVHTSDNPNGEIRGQIEPVTVLP